VLDLGGKTRFHTEPMRIAMTTHPNGKVTFTRRP
jgi:hypothetical protein